jgi:Zn finger protein HypA/HybF involved in hydrogenase expression
MPVSVICNNSYKDGKKDKKCGETEPYMDPKTEKAYCPKCNKEVAINHFQKTTMKTLKQFKEKSTDTFNVKCQNCGKEATPQKLNEEIVCPHCKKIHQHLSEPFKIMLREQLKTVNKEL